MTKSRYSRRSRRLERSVKNAERSDAKYERSAKGVQGGKQEFPPLRKGVWGKPRRGVPQQRDASYHDVKTKEIFQNKTKKKLGARTPSFLLRLG